MPFPLLAVATDTKVGAFFKKVFTSKWLYVVLLLAAVGGGIYFTLNHWKNEAVSTAVTGADQKATTKSLEADGEVNRRVESREQPLIILREQTIKDYANARATLEAQPAADRDAPAPRVIIDTLNDLDLLRSAREPGAVPDAEVPVG